MATDTIPQLRGDFGWRWPYEVPRDGWRIAPFGLCLLIYLAGARLFFQQNRATALLLWSTIATIALTITGLFITYDPFAQLYSVTLGASASPWHYAASHIPDIGATLRRWPDFMTEAFTSTAGHLGISPPGPVVMFSAINSFLAQFPSLANALGRPLRALQCHQFSLLSYTNAEFAGAWPGILMPVWASLTVWPLYYFGKQISNEVAARWSVVWWPLIPSILLFTPSLYVVYPFFSLLIFAALTLGLQQDRPVLVVMAGVIASWMTFMTFAFAPLLFMAGLMTLGIQMIQPRRLAWHWPIRMGLWFGAGLSVVWIGYYWLTGVSPLDILQRASKLHLDLGRPYWPWLVLHLNDLFMFTGWPLIFLAGLGVWRTVALWRAQSKVTMGGLLGLVLSITVLALDIAGVMRGESGRILAYMMPFIVLIAADVVSTMNASSGKAIALAQAAVALVMVTFLRVIGAEFYERPPAAPPSIAPPTTAGYPVAVQFGEVLKLQSMAGQITRRVGQAGQPEKIIDVWLDWRSSGQMDVPYYYSFIPVSSADGSTLNAYLQQPFDGAYPITCWFPESGLMRTRTEVPLQPSETLRSGEYWLSLSLIDGETGQQVAVQLPDGTEDVQVGIGPFFDTQSP
ncbi:MAG: hypothetical protein ACT4QE_25930 [Anaerolineales bacterium]